MNNYYFTIGEYSVKSPIDPSNLEVFHFGPQLVIRSDNDSEMHFLSCLLCKDESRLLGSHIKYFSSNKDRLVKELASCIRVAFHSYFMSIDKTILMNSIKDEEFLESATKYLDATRKSNLYNSLFDERQVLDE